MVKLVAISGLLILAVACSSESNMGGDGLPVQNPSESYGHSAEPITGTLTLDSKGCWFLNVDDVEHLIVFPRGFTQASEGVAMVGPDGTRFAPGSAVSGSGGVVSIDGFPGVPDGYWGGYFVFCKPDPAEVLVIDSMVPSR
jgi:hypothetical protein